MTTDARQAADLIAGNSKKAISDAGATGLAGSILVPIDSIKVMEGFNVRLDDTDRYKAHIRWLADSIKANGFYGDKPLAGFVRKTEDGEEIVVTDGHSRLVAAKLAITEGAPLTSLPMVLKPAGTSVEDMVVALATSNGGLPLTTVEQAFVAKRLVSFGWDTKKIAAALALTVQYVNDLLMLLAGPAAVLDLVANDKISATLAITELKKAPEKATAILKAAVTKALAEGKTRATAKHTKPKADKKATPAAAETKPEKTGPSAKELALTKSLEKAKTELAQKAADLEAMSKRTAPAAESKKDLKAKEKEIAAAVKEALAKVKVAPVKTTATLSHDGMVDTVFAILADAFEADESYLREVGAKIVNKLFPGSAVETEAAVDDPEAGGAAEEPAEEAEL